MIVRGSGNRGSRNRPLLGGGGVVDSSESEPADDGPEAWDESLTPCLQVLRACQQGGDDQAWADLYLMIEDAVSRPISRWLRRFGFSESEAEVVVLELVEALYMNDCRMLRSCRAHCDAMFHGWLRTVARHFTLDWVAHPERNRRESCAPGLDAVDESGPDEFLIRVFLNEWQPEMKPKHFHRLLILMGWHVLEQEPAERTLRHWRQELSCGYRHLFLGD